MKPYTEVTRNMKEQKMSKYPRPSVLLRKKKLSFMNLKSQKLSTIIIPNTLQTDKSKRGLLTSGRSRIQKQ